MKKRLHDVLAATDEQGQHFNWVVIMGGINDLLGDWRNPKLVAAGLMTMFDNALEHGANVLSLGLADWGIDGVEHAFPIARSGMAVIRAAIKDYADAHAPAVSYYDLGEALPYDEPPVNGSSIYSDGVHFTEKGVMRHASQAALTFETRQY